MLNSTRNPLSKEQFSKLREARELIKTQFDADFSLQSNQLIDNLYGFAVSSESNELFRLFVDLNELFDTPLERPLNEEQFVLLREAKGYIAQEFDETLPLEDADVMAKLYEFALASKAEDLFDIYTYLGSRPEQSDKQLEVVPGPYFRQLRQAKTLAHQEFKQEVPLHGDEVVITLVALAADSKNTALKETVNSLGTLREDMPTITELSFKELSAPNFQQLRDAKMSIHQEFGEDFSLHAKSALDDFYSFALRSEESILFNLFSELTPSQMAAKDASQGSRDWYCNEQYTLLRNARDSIRAEFDETIQMQSESLRDDLYQYALRSTDETLFDLCWEFQQLSPPIDQGRLLPSKEEFRMLRQARALVSDEFSQDLPLLPGLIEADLYKYAVSSETDQLFDLYTDLMALPSSAISESSEASNVRLNKEELTTLRDARRMILKEFDTQLALENADVLDHLYEFALISETDELFDLHSDLNAKAIEQDALSTTKAKEPLQNSEAEEVENEALELSKEQLKEQPKEQPKKFSLPKVLNLWGKKSTASNAHGNESNNESKNEPDTTSDAATATDSKLLEIAKPIDTTTPSNSVSESASESASENTPVIEPETTTKITTEIATELKSTPTTIDASNSSFSDKLVAATERAKQNNQSIAKPTDDKRWYVSASDDRFRVSLSRPLSVKANGELVVAANDSGQPCALIELVGNKPIISARQGDLLVNSRKVKDNCTLISGDNVEIAGSVLRVEFLHPQPAKNQKHQENTQAQTNRRAK